MGKKPLIFRQKVLGRLVTNVWSLPFHYYPLQDLTAFFYSLSNVFLIAETKKKLIF